MAARVFLQFLFLGCISFGGPSAHIAYFRQVFVDQRHWISEEEFARQLALCQFLPGPASSQLGFAIALRRGGLPAAIAAFIGFTLPSFVLMYSLAVFTLREHPEWLSSVIAGMKILALVVVADALINMARQFCRGAALAATAMASAVLMSLAMQPMLQVSVMALAGLLAYWRSAAAADANHAPPPLSIEARGYWALLLFVALLVLALIGSGVFSQFYLVGSLVFGGGHVALPLLQSFLGDAISGEQFIVGYAAAQAVPGPMFSLAAFLGASLQPENALPAALLACVGVFLPGFLLLLAVTGWWQQLAQRPPVMAAIAAVNAVVVGMLGAAWLNPLLLQAPGGWAALLLAVLLFGALRSQRVPLIILVIAALLYAKFLL